MASGKTMQAIISLAGKIDPSLEKAIQGVEKKLAGISKMKGAASAAAKVGSTIAKGVAVAGGAVASATMAAGASALQNYSQYEQLIGGIDTLFKESSGTVQQYAAEAYKTAGVSANTYMEQATNFSASLIQSLGGDTEAAAQYADLAIKDMSDNANKMGTDISSIQQTYQSLMRGNYAMLDNLKLGYGGTKTELERLVSDASKLTGESLDPSKFSDVIKAIHAVQDNLGITGTTALEAATTIEGSVNTAKSAWDNWLTGLGRSDSDMGELTDQLMDSIGSVAKNVGPVVQRIAQSVAKSLPDALSGAFGAVAPALSEALAGIWNTVSSTLGLGLPELTGEDIFSGLTGALQMLQPLISSVGPALSGLIQAVGPPLASMAQAVLPPLMSALSAVLPLLSQIVMAILPPLIGFLTPIISACMQIISAILPPLTSLVSALTPIISAIVGVATSLLNSFIVPLIGPLTNIVNSLLPPVAGLLGALSGPISSLCGFLGTLAGALSPVVGFLGDLVSLAGQAAGAIADLAGGAIGGIASFFGYARGGFTTGPYVAGEDPRYPNEAVISFNPAYRAQNVRYWQMAGHMLGAYSAPAAPVTAAASGGGTVIDLSGMTYSPRVEVRGNASKDDVVAALRQSQAEFGDFLAEVLASRAEVAYA